jgi:Fur family zinc uptake transcriptional regulator
LRAVARSRRPVKAYDLIKNSGDKDKKPMPPIVYRALDFWVSHGFIHRIESLNAYTCCTHPGCGHDCQILICSQCGRVFEFCDAALSSELVAAAKRQGFKIEAFKVEAEGRCPDCR